MGQAGGPRRISSRLLLVSFTATATFVAYLIQPGEAPAFRNEISEESVKRNADTDKNASMPEALASVRQSVLEAVPEKSLEQLLAELGPAEPDDLISDEEWDGYQRVGRPVVDLVRTWTGTKDNYLRSTCLNPRDQRLSESFCSVLDQFLAARIPTLIEQHKAHHQVAHRELRALIEAGVARTRDYRDYVQSLPLEKREVVAAEIEETVARYRENGATEEQLEYVRANTRVEFDTVDLLGFVPHAYANLGDAFYGAELHELPKAHEDLIPYLYAILDTAESIASMFRAEGALTRAEYELSVARTMNRLDTLYPLAQWR